MTNVPSMSAGTIVFTLIMSEQMLSFMKRIHRGKKLKWNLSRPSNSCNRDFERLWVYFSERRCVYFNRERNSKLMVRDVTGMEFTMDHFVIHFEERRQLLDFAQQARKNQALPAPKSPSRPCALEPRGAQISPYKEPLCTAHLTSARSHQCLGA